MRVSYKGLEEEASDLFAAIESRHKGKNVAGRELNSSSSMNYDSKRILLNPALFLVIMATLLSHYESKNSQLECSRS